ncbi:unnamed protein product [Rotaria magnacalcarata]|uniref:Uncharacterized protein n=1 Tax=Rotaria magnacalcarata TaxID=392030 RepID=A0A814SJJ0_9BILA|nr:unnamed protein product [Rotaria magnacalcarata]CAF1649548.1 unnamed protein product [Rotaria magnacalcarata]CAF2091351.1 unnamed protein product [Rotaria magnacalcarata]CAF4278436.1 unnamed protein product [Rotaria magnacalcarata]CAF4408514.1 unnamed protein product [Rotaria magnacalcarata]
MSLLIPLVPISCRREKYGVYRSNLAVLAKLKSSSSINDSCNLSLPPSLYINTNVDFYRDKLSFMFYTSTLILLVYLWHRTVRLIPCLFLIIILAILTFSTDLLLYSDNIILIADNVNIFLIITMISLELFMPHVCDDPLLWLCLAIYDNPVHYRDTDILEKNNKVKCIYERMKNMKSFWNIQEEKLVITAIVLPIVASITIIMNINGFIIK